MLGQTLTGKATQATGGDRYEMLGQTVTSKATQAKVGVDMKCLVRL